MDGKVSLLYPSGKATHSFSGKLGVVLQVLCVNLVGVMMCCVIYSDGVFVVISLILLVTRACISDFVVTLV